MTASGRAPAAQRIVTILRTKVPFGSLTGHGLSCTVAGEGGGFKRPHPWVGGAEAALSGKDVA